MTATEDFVKQADAYRPELLAHCYRMVGSVHDAEDAVQETYLRAWPATEVAALLDTTVGAVTSALQGARARLAEVMPAEDETAEPTDAEGRALLARYVTALQTSDMAGLVALLREDAELEMPPI